jgi:hypothetical protein
MLRLVLIKGIKWEEEGLPDTLSGDRDGDMHHILTLFYITVKMQRT